jgi:glycosyltransferase involved in cell wall biosynthesis
VLNIHKSYQACANTEIKNFNLKDTNTSSFEIYELAKDIEKFNPDVITIMDHKPHPIHLIKSLSFLYQGQKKPKIIFHIFGDFTLNFPLWEYLGPNLKGFKIEFLVASDRQKTLVDKMFLKNSTIICPFSVDPRDFFPDQELRIKQRAEWNLTDRDVAFIFTGRLSRQKRIKTLITSFANEFANDPHAHLFLYGKEDNIGDPFLGIWDDIGEYFRIFYSAYKALPSQIQSRIHFYRQVPNAELQQIYQGADIFINVSVHNDEDFGMSVAEAQFVGLPAGLTDWGGLASFQHAQIPEATSFIPVRIGTKFKHVSISGIQKTLRAFYQNPNRDKRSLISSAANNKFGILKVAKIIQKVIDKDSIEFGGYSPLFYKASKASQISNKVPMYLTKDLKLNDLYRDIYSAYVRNE